MQLILKYKKDTMTCYVFQHGEHGSEDCISVYLKKHQVDAAGINPRKGIVVTVEEGHEAEI